MTALNWILYAVFACPMLALFLVSCFKVDSAVACPQRAVIRRRNLPVVDRNGFPMCVDPDGRWYPRAH
jgi:hypothetical protein